MVVRTSSSVWPGLLLLGRIGGAPCTVRRSRHLTSKIAETAQRIVDRALEEARRREHPLLTGEHIFLAFAQVEWDLFAEVMRDIELNPHTILQAIEEHLHMMPPFPGSELRVSPATRLVFKLALHHASRAGRQTIEAADCFAVSRRTGRAGFDSAPPRRRARCAGLAAHARMRTELRDERLRSVRAAGVPQAFRHHLNLLARQDKIPPVFARDKEIHQVLEILCHRERPNSVMLIGEPGVGKTAIVEGLARRLEFEPETVPVRLRDCQVVNLQMNTMVAGTMLRGMFEDRIQNVIRELKERTNLILFVDEAHTMVGAGSALGAPSDAANIFKSCWLAARSGWWLRRRSANTRNTFRRTKRWRGASVRLSCASHQSKRRGAFSRICARASSGTTQCGFSTSAIDTVLEMSPRYMRHLHLPTR